MKKLEILSQISRDIGQVLFASMFIAPIYGRRIELASYYSRFNPRARSVVYEHLVRFIRFK